MSRTRTAGVTPVEWLARAGYGARGLVYVAIGVFAMMAAGELRGSASGSDGALRLFAGWPLGPLWLGLMALGLAGFVLWRVAQAVFDADRVGKSRKALAKRAGQGLSAAIYAALAWSFFEAMDGLEDVREGEKDVESFNTVLALPYGELLLSGVGVAIFVAGALNLLHGMFGNFRRHLTGDSDLHRWTIPVARTGYSARGLVFLAVGFFLLRAAFDLASMRDATLAGAFAAIEAQPFGSLVAGLTGAGLIAFGLFGLVEARYRRMVVPEALRGD